MSQAQPADSWRIQRLRAWVTAALEHTPGEVDRGVRDVRGWGAADLEDVRDHVYAVIRLIHLPTASTFVKPGDRARNIASRPLAYSRFELGALRAIAGEVALRGGPNQLLRRGAMLHTDIANRAPPDPSPLEDRSNALLQQRTVLLLDGRAVANGNAVGHWQMARSLLDSITGDARGEKPEPAKDPFVALWYRAVGCFMLLHGRLWLPHFERGVQLFPRDAELLLLAGALHEALAAPRIQDAVNARDIAGIGFDERGRTVYFETGVRSPRDELRDAEEYLRRAVTVDAAHVEARIHLGRVLMLRERPTDAVKELEAAGTAASAPLLRYYAALFLGRAAESAGNLTLAQQSYEQAAELYPRAQSPRLALSRIAHASGAPRPGALNAVLALSADERERWDPWWSYDSSVGRDADASTVSLHGMLLAGDRK